jgi:uncharacterized membrane protein
MGNNRAAQFMPFAALKGYYDLIAQAGRVAEPKKELSEEEVDALNVALNQVRKGRMVRATYYHGDGYVVIEGLVSGFEPVAQKLRVVKTAISFDDLLSLEFLDDAQE